VLGDEAVDPAHLRVHGVREAREAHALLVGVRVRVRVRVRGRGRGRVRVHALLLLRRVRSVDARACLLEDGVVVGVRVRVRVRVRVS